MWTTVDPQHRTAVFYSIPVEGQPVIVPLQAGNLDLAFSLAWSELVIANIAIPVVPLTCLLKVQMNSLRWMVARSQWLQNFAPSGQIVNSVKVSVTTAGVKDVLWIGRLIFHIFRQRRFSGILLFPRMSNNAVYQTVPGDSLFIDLLQGMGDGAVEAWDVCEGCTLNGDVC